MAKVPLRTYTREIEGMIEGGKLEEAVAHCQHILKSYPMHVETYRLLGKSFLEARRYGDAADIFQRALMAVPDDFVAHVGMSIIRDDEGKLDDAIWHMERAFEAQPSNPAIQGELRRLYGRRDGVEPPKIRLSRDALANMYAQGELFNQAIAEIRAVMAEDANRPDLQVMLARAYFRSGQKIEAAEMAANLLKKYTYCVDALRILVEVLPGSARAENTQVYRQRLRLLDPYSSFVAGSVFNTDQVADTAVTLERLEYLAGATLAAPQPNWASSLGIKLTDEKRSEPTPDWLKATDTSEPIAPQVPGSSANGVPPADGKSVPDWMRSGGWQESSGSAQESSAVSGLEQPTEQIAKADIPDWLKAMAPQELTETAAEPEPTPIKPDSSNAGDLPDWMAGMDAGAAEMNTDSESTSLPTPSESAGDLPNRLTGIDATAAEVNTDSEPTPPAPLSSSEGDLPDWLAGMGTGAAEVNAASDQTKDKPLPEREGELPDWLAVPGEVTAESKAESQSLSPNPPPFGEGKTSDWLSDPGVNSAKTGNEPSQPDTLPEDIVAFPDWLTEIGSDVSSGIAMAVPENPLEQPITELPQEPTGPAQTAQVDQEPVEPVASSPHAEEEVPFQPTGESKPLDIEDDTMAWLEGLAARQGAKEEELLTKPGDRGEKLPDWLRPGSDQPVSAATPEPLPAPIETKRLEPLPLQGMELKSQEFALSEEQPPLESSAEGTAKPLTIEDDTLAWLEGLAAKQGAKEEELLSKPEDRQAEIPEWLRSVNQLPSESTKPEPSTAPKETMPLEAFIPHADEYGSQDQEPTDSLLTNPHIGSENIPDWLRSFNEPPSSPTTRESPLASDENLSYEKMPPNAGGFEAQEQTTADGLSTYPESELEGVPDWLRPAGEQTLATPSEGTSQPLKDESLDWLDDLEFEEKAKAEEPLGNLPDLSETSSDRIQETKPEPAAPDEGPVSGSLEEDMSITSWLSKLDVEEALGKKQPDTKAVQPETTPSTDLPDWLKGMEESGIAEETPKPVEDLPDWLREPGQSNDNGTNAIPMSGSAPEPELPSWVDEETPVSEKTEATSPGEWIPVDEKPRLISTTEPEVESVTGVVETPVVETIAESGADVADAPVVEPITEPVADVVEAPIVEPIPEPARVVTQTQVQPGVLKGTGMLARIPVQDKDAEFLAAAQAALDANKLDEAMRGYITLIKKNRLLDAVIHDLHEAIYRFPVDIIVWQTLGDASMRANRLQDALDAYTKAEELLR